MKRMLVTLTWALICLIVVSCGGGGSSSSGSQSTSTSGQAQGVYIGNTSTGFAFNGIILPNDKFYAIYGTMIGNVLYVCGIATGQGTSANGTYTATENDFDYCGGTQAVYTGTVAGTYTAGSSLNGTISENGNSETFSGTAPPNSQFNYGTPASLAAISGSWSGSLTDGESASVSIDSSGNTSGVSSSGCTFTATITADSSNKDFFDISLTFGGSPCELPNQTATGIGVDYLLSDGITSQLIAGVSSGTSFGIVFAAQR